jgi:hypothetical protein
MAKWVLMVVASAGLLLGQGRVGPVGHGFGNVIFPGTGIPQPSGHIPNLSSTIRGVYPGQPQPPIGRGPGRPGRTQPVVVPVPVYVGGYGYGGGYGYYDQQPQPQPNITVVNTPQPAPSVIINQGYVPDRAQPVMRDYPGNSELNAYQAPVPSHPEPVKPAPARADNDDAPTVYLIALKDGTVYSAYAYWLEADTLHYITTRHSHNKASLPLVDESLSLQLNRERAVEFKLKGR